MNAKDLYARLESSNPNIYNITHIADFDGVASASMLVHYLNLPVDHILFGNHQAKDFERLTEAINKVSIKNSVVLFTDLSINDVSIPTIKAIIERLKSDNNEIAWIDHHQWSDTALKEVGELCIYMIAGENPKYCAAELVFNNLFSQTIQNDDFGPKIAEIAHYADFNLKSDKYDALLYSLAGSIAYINDSVNPEEQLREMISYVSKGDIDNPVVKEAYAKYLQESGENIKELEKSTSSFYAGSIKVGIGYGKGIGSTQACAIIEQKEHSGISIFINKENGKISLRSIKGLECLPLAVALGGGGHPQAAGGEVSKDYLGMENWTQEFTEHVKSIAAKTYAEHRY